MTTSRTAKPRTERTAKVAYDENRLAAEQALQYLLTKVSQRAPENVNWGHVGDMAYIARQLTEITDSFTD